MTRLEGIIARFDGFDGFDRFDRFDRFAVL